MLFMPIPTFNELWIFLLVHHIFSYLLLILPNTFTKQIYTIQSTNLLSHSKTKLKHVTGDKTTKLGQNINFLFLNV